MRHTYITQHRLTTSVRFRAHFCCHILEGIRIRRDNSCGPATEEELWPSAAKAGASHAYIMPGTVHSARVMGVPLNMDSTT